jgi:dihydrofolate synthase/folylpolyglutamate synthase
MVDMSALILERFRTQYGKDIDLTLRPAYRDLLVKLGSPHHHLPPVFHIAGTNGKGSTCAFLRAMLEAAGRKVHVYTSPHLVTFHERIRIAGQLISESELADILRECENIAAPGSVSYFEAATAAAFIAFARHPADFVILETGLGGRLDATNVIEKPLATIITRLSCDHREYLGNTLAEIAREKAGIMRPGVRCFTAPQPSAEALQSLSAAAEMIGAKLIVGDRDWQVKETKDGFHFADATRDCDLPQPCLLGIHQYQNAGLAIAALASVPQPLLVKDIVAGLQSVEWPARLQHLTRGALVDLVPDAEVWLDGGHNDSAGEVLAAQIERWQRQDGAQPKPLYVVLGMLTTKHPSEFLSPFATSIAGLMAVPVPHEPLSFTPEALADVAHETGVANVTVAEDIREALSNVAAQALNARILVCGSLYLVGAALALSERG